MVAVLGYSKEQIAVAVKQMYAAVATSPEAYFHFPVGREACRAVGYPDELIAGLPPSAVESFAGVGCPFRAGTIREGDVVLDLGSGSGVDSLIASRLVGPQGRVWALDMTPAMLEKLRVLVAASGIGNVEVIEGTAEAIPLPDDSVDVITSNGVLNLVPDKRRAIGEMFRVLRAGGCVQIADIVIEYPVTPDCLGDPKLWAECVVGATVREDYLDMFRDAGFFGLEVLRTADYFRHSPSAETREVAKSFQARSIELKMRRAAAGPSRGVQIARRLDPRRLARQASRRGFWGMLGLGGALVACYGTLAVVSALPLLGITLAVDERLWASAIVLFAAFTALAVALGFRRHRRLGAPILSAAGASAVVYALVGSYDPRIELAGFVLLASAVFWDMHLHKRSS